MKGYNHVTIQGIVVGGIELKRSQRGLAFMDMIIGVHEATKNRDTNQWWEKETDIPVVFFSETAEDVAQTIHLGDHVIVVGKIRVETITSKAGNEYPRISIMGMSCDVIGGTDNSANAATSHPAPQEPSGARSKQNNDYPDHEDTPF